MGVGRRWRRGGKRWKRGGKRWREPTSREGLCLLPLASDGRQHRLVRQVPIHSRGADGVQADALFAAERAAFDALRQRAERLVYSVRVLPLWFGETEAGPLCRGASGGAGDALVVGEGERRGGVVGEEGRGGVVGAEVARQ